MSEWLRRVVLRQAGLNLLVAAAVLTGLSCGGEGVEPPTSGSLEVRTVTGGTEPDADGYGVTIDDGPGTPLGANATLQHGDLEAGPHSVRLTGMAANCAVAGDNPRSISILAGETTTISFQLTCSATVGSLQITSATTGPSPDPDGYTISLDGSERGPLAVNGTATLDGLMPGSHAVGLSGMVANCQVQGDNPRPVTVTAGASATAAFAVVCAAPPPGAGSLLVTTSTSGPDPDPNGYAFAVDGGSRQPIGINATTTLANVATGAHTVRLSGLAANCSVQGANSRSVTVTTGTTAQVSFAITCTATTGSLTITTTTTGPSLDPDGYTASVDGGTGQPIGINGTLFISTLPAGTHTVALAELATNCAVQGNPRTVTIIAGASATAAFTISCSTPGVMRWTPMVSGTTNTLTAVSGSSATNVFVVDAGAIRHYDGTSWSLQPAPGAVSAVWAHSATDAFAVGSGGLGTFLHYNGQQWSAMVPPPALPNVAQNRLDINAVWGSSGADVFVVGEWIDFVDDGGDGDLEGVGWVAHYDGTAWSSSHCCGTNLNDVWGSSKNDVYVVGFDYFAGDNEQDGVFVEHYDGNGWSGVLQEYGSDQDFSQVWGSSASDVYVTDTGNDVLWHFDGRSWSALVTPMPEFGAMWGSSATDIFMIAGGNEIWHFDGATWKKVHTSTSSLHDIWGSSATDVFVVGENGLILHGTP